MVNTFITKSVNIFYMDTENELVKAINNEMQRRNMSVREASRFIGVSHPTLMKALAGEKITFDFADQLSRFLHMSTEQVLRIAGLLPKLEPRTAEHERLLHQYDLLKRDQQIHLMNYIDFLLSN